MESSQKTEKSNLIFSSEIGTHTYTKTIVESAINVESKDLTDLSKLDEETFRQITTSVIPKCEMILASNHITQLEKVVNWDYFEGRNSKTPQRYLKVSEI